MFGIENESHFFWIILGYSVQAVAVWKPQANVY